MRPPAPVPGAGLLFGIDGTRTDTDHLHLAAFIEVFAKAAIAVADFTPPALRGFTAARVVRL